MNKRTYSIEQQLLFVLFTNGYLLTKCPLNPDDFSTETNRIIYQAMVDVDKQHKPIDIISIAEHIENTYRNVDMEYLGNIFEKGVGIAGSFDNYVNIIRETSRKNKGKQIAWNLQKQLEENFNDYDPIQAAIQELMKVDSNKQSYDKTIKECLEAGLKCVQDAHNSGGLVGIPTGLKSLDEAIGGYHDSDLYVFGARPAMGKSQPLTSDILLADGSFKKMGDLSIGDKLASIDGKESQVSNIYPQGLRSIYKLILSDGREVKCDIEHLWSVRSCKLDGLQTFTTGELFEMLKKERFRNRISLENHTGDFGTQTDLNIDPWLLGFLIGDGTFQKSSVRFSTSESYTYQKILKCLPEGHEVKYLGAYDYRIVFPQDAKINPTLNAIKSLGLEGSTSEFKFLPKEALSATKEFREQLLSGLLESDGWISGASIQYSTASRQLALDIQDLVRSLGGSASYRIKTNTQYEYKGEKLKGKPAHILSICVPNIAEIVDSPRLLKNLTIRKKTCAPIIRAIEYINEEQAQCIKVSHPSSLYITDGYTVTHNTAFLFCSALANDVCTGIISAEQGHAQAGLRFISISGSVHSQNMRSANLSEAEWSRVSAGTINAQKKNIFLNDEPGISITGLIKQARLWKFNNNLQILFVDYIQKIKGTNPNAKKYEQVTEVVGALKQLARELDIPVVALAQVKRDVDTRSDRRPKLGDMSDASEIEKEADAIFTLYRDEVYNQDTMDKGIAEIDAVKNRHGPTGTIRCLFEGKYFQFKDFPTRAGDE